MARSKRHHYIPEVMQKRFVSDEGSYWFGDPRGQEPAFHWRTPRGCFWERNLNTIEDRDGTPSDTLEVEFWKNVDDQLTEIFSEIDDAFGNNEVPIFESDALASFQHLMTLIMRRSPDATNLPSPIEVGAEFEARVAERLTALGLPRDSKPRTTHDLAQKGRDVVARMKARRSEVLVNAISDYDVVWAKSFGRPSFLLGSKAVYRAPNGGSGHLDDPRTELFCPISPKLALVMLRRSAAVPILNEANGDLVREWNEHIFLTSAFVASSERKLITRLAGMHRKKPRFIKK